MLHGPAAMRIWLLICAGASGPRRLAHVGRHRPHDKHHDVEQSRARRFRLGSHTPMVSGMRPQTRL